MPGPVCVCACVHKHPMIALAYMIYCTMSVQVDVQPAAASNPGIPPSSLSSFLRVKPSLPGVVLAEHQGPFTNPYYQSRFDTVDNIQPASLAAAAVVLARALHGLAAGKGTPDLKVYAWQSKCRYILPMLLKCLHRCACAQHAQGAEGTKTVVLPNCSIVRT